MVFFYLWIFLRKFHDSKAFFFLQFITQFYPHDIPADCVQVIQFFLFSLQRTKGIKAVEWLVKKSQVLGEIGRHHSIIGLGKVLLNPRLDGRIECEIWGGVLIQMLFLFPSKSTFSSFLEDEDRKMKDSKTQFFFSFY